MRIAPNFEDLLPNSSDAEKMAIRGKLVYALNSQGEILPSANSPRGKLWHLVNSSESSIDECEEVILLDSALAARIFRVANSAAHGARAENISRAILHLGFKSIREQAFNSTIFNQYASWSLPPEWDLFWLRNIFVARLCERLAATYCPTDGSEYLTGLLHDVGWLFLATYLPSEFTTLFNGESPIDEAEKELLPFGHAQISGAIAARSLLPLRTINAILYHHNPVMTHTADIIEPAKSPRFLGSIVKICDHIADSCQMNMFGSVALTMEEILESPEALWLNQFGEPFNFAVIAEEELFKSQEIFNVFFSTPVEK